MSKGRTQAIAFEVPEHLAEAAAFWLHEEMAWGVEIRDRETLPPPGVQPVPEGRAAVIGFFSEDAPGERLAHEIRAALEEHAEGAEVVARVNWIDHEDWAESWKLHFQPMHVGGKLWVVPPWEARPERQPAVVIEPGMAFGTGGHETTALCLEGIVEHLRPGASVLDLGCGSGILGLAASVLGAGRVVMVDNDPVAVEVARQNVQGNRREGIELSETAIEDIKETFDLVLANILALTLIELAAPVSRTVAPGGSLLLSGIRVEQAIDVRDAYEAQGLRHHATRSQGEWVMIHMVRG